MRYQLIMVLALAYLGCTQNTKETDQVEDSKSSDSEAAVPPANITGSYLACREVDSDSEVFALRCDVKDQNNDQTININEGFSSFSWNIQRQDLRLRPQYKMYPSSGSLYAAFQGISYDEGKKLASNSQVKLQLVNNQKSFLLSDLISPPENRELSRDFTVFFIDGIVLNHYVEGSTPLVLPTAYAPYQGLQGCYLACYSFNNAGAVYPVSDTIFVKGQYRVEGAYEANMCRPKGFESGDIAEVEQFSKLCSEHVSSCQGGDCWSGGDTGGWFGLQPVGP